MSSELIVFEKQLNAVSNEFEDVLAGRMPPARLIRTLVISCQRTPKLLECNRQSLMNASVSFGVLALEVDGFTGQGYILPFAGVAQPCIGYKGYNTIGARSALTITGDVRREGDEFDYAKGTKAFLHHKPSDKAGGRIIGAWAVATARDRPPIIEVLRLDELEAIRKKAPGSKKADSPWNDEAIGLPAMYAKSAKRRLARSTPMNWASPEFQYAAVMEEAFEERGQHSYIAPGRGVVIDGQTSPLPVRGSADDTPGLGDLSGPKDPPELAALKIEGREAAEISTDVLMKWWGRLSPRQRAELEKFKDEMKAVAAKADEESKNAD